MTNTYDSLYNVWDPVLMFFEKKKIDTLTKKFTYKYDFLFNVLFFMVFDGTKLLFLPGSPPHVRVIQRWTDWRVGSRAGPGGPDGSQCLLVCEYYLLVSRDSGVRVRYHSLTLSISSPVTRLAVGLFPNLCSILDGSTLNPSIFLRQWIGSWLGLVWCRSCM